MSNINKENALKQLKEFPKYLCSYCKELALIDEYEESYDKDNFEKLKSVVIIDFMLIDNIKYEVFSKKNYRKLKKYKEKLMIDFLTSEEITQIEKIIRDTIDNFADAG